MMYRRILVPVDGSELAERVIPHVQTLARIGEVEEVVLLRAVEPIKSIAGADVFLSDEEVKTLQESHEKDAGVYLDQLVKKLRFQEVTVTSKVIVGRAAETIADYASHHQVDLIVMATHGRSGLSRWVLGSVAERILHWSCTPILIVRPPECMPQV
jgi:nucleotide-binding universal stress UspA family protein